ncbi:hypothetical protein [Algoriphagus namhaensis]
MKSQLLRFALLAILISTISACGGDNPTPPAPVQTPEEIAVEKLTGPNGSQTWGIQGGGTVTRDGRAVTDLYQNFTLILRSGSARTYTSSNNNDLFDNSGNWSFTDGTFTKFELTGTKPAAGREITFVQNEDNLRLDFTIPAPGARINGVFAIAGSYTFNLKKN